MARSNRSYTISNMICPDCGKAFPIPRLKSSARERGHIKDLYCPFCNKISKMLEIKENDFAFETKQNNISRQHLKLMLY